MKAIRLKTEYLLNPMGIDIDCPRLFWNCEDGVAQSAYQIIAADDNGTILWDSGKAESPSMRAQWGGAPVPVRTAVTWKVLLWDEKGEPGDWAEGRFETGLPKGQESSGGQGIPMEKGTSTKESWRAKWIAGNYPVNKKRRYPVDCFRKVFNVSPKSVTVSNAPHTVSGNQTGEIVSQPVTQSTFCSGNRFSSAGAHIKKARLYITACGLYEARLNGTRVGNFVLAPGHTDYRKRVQYQTYDVTGLLAEGENVLTVQLADGWYRGSCGAWGIRNQYGTQTKLLAQLEITGQDGSMTLLCTDETWEWSNDGPIRFADNQDGEVVDASRTPSYSGRALVVTHPVIPAASNNVPVTEHETFKPGLITTPSGKTVLDFGQNIAGYLAFSIQGKKGQKLKLRFGELLDKDGEFTQKNIQCSNKKMTTPLQQVEYLCRDGRNDYKTTFAIFGFQYVLVEGDITVEPANFTAIAVYSDMERTGWFHSSNQLLNRLFDCTLWSAKNNHADLPTDCPTRERHGWTGDAQIFFNTAAYLFDFAPFARKYLHDVFDWQEKSGRLPHITPEGGADFYMRSMNGSVGWSDVGILMPWRYAEIFGDETILREFYDGMACYARFMERRCGKNMPLFAERIKLPGEMKKYLVNTGQSYGEWAEPTDVSGGFKWTDFVAPHPEVSTAYTSYVLGIMADIAGRLGHEEDAKEFRTCSDGCRRAYRQLVRTEKYKLDTDRQARLVRPLYFELLDEEQESYAKKRLIQALEHYGWRLGTGFLSTPLILYVLASYDLEAAYRLLENEEIPGWLSMPKHGATTIWEDWEGPYGSQSGIASLNHYSKGAVVEWLFTTMCGIRVAGENRFTIAPRPGGHFTHAKADYISVYGRVESGWRKTGDGMEFTVTIPANCTALVRLPDGSQREQGAGTRSYFISEVD